MRGESVSQAAEPADPGPEYPSAMNLSGAAKPNPRWSRKAAVVAACVAVTVGLSGFFMGMRQTHRASAALKQEQVPNAPAAADLASNPTAPRYAELAGGALHPNRDWVNQLERLHSTPLVETLARTAREQEAARTKRASRRQYDGAPPIAPHPVDQHSPASCLSCHGTPTSISGAPVPQMSHELLTNCLQCHVSSVGPTSMWRGKPTVTLADHNTFAGRGAPEQGTRAYTGAPPTIPHGTVMRESCLSCHGPGGSSAFRSTHPERTSCLQCHATNAVLDRRPVVSQTPPPMPASP